MSVTRGDYAMPVFTAHRDTVLNATLSPHARLLYVVLLASGVDVELEDVAPLVGVTSSEDLRPYIAELQTVGAADMKDHVGRGEVLVVHQMPYLPAERTHACVPCQDCNACSCFAGLSSLCEPCGNIRQAREQARRDIARWKAEVAAGCTYAYNANRARLHRWDCNTLNTPEKSLAALEDCIAAQGGLHAYAYWQRLPDLYTAEQLRKKGVKKKGCHHCGPDPL